MTIRIILHGSTGMLGKAIRWAIANDSETVEEWLVPRAVDITNPVDLFKEYEAARASNPECVVLNAAGVISSKRPVIEHVEVNALAPHFMAQAAEAVGAIPFIHVSTDCVFAGRPKPYVERDTPDATSLYGMTKALGEVRGSNVTVVRTSFVGPDHGIVPWFFAHPEGAVVEGWTNALWTGRDDRTIALRLVQLAKAQMSNVRGELVHLAAHTVISKYDLLVQLHRYRPDIKLRQTDGGVGRVLTNTKMKISGFQPITSEALRDVVERTPQSPLYRAPDRVVPDDPLYGLRFREQRGLPTEGLER